jgi:hypothetical protein
MLKKLTAFAILPAALAIAGNIPTPGSSFQVTLSSPCVVNGTELQPGDYRVSVGENKITWIHGQIMVDAPAKIETVETKFANTAVYTVQKDKKQVISEIDVKGSKAKILLNQ